MIRGKMTHVLTRMTLHVLSIPVSVVQLFPSFIPDQFRDTSPDPVSTVSGDFLYTFLYSEKEEVRKNDSGIRHPSERNPRSPEDFNRRSLVVVLFIFRISFSTSPSRSLRMSILPESIADTIYPVRVLTLDEESHPVLE